LEDWETGIAQEEIGGKSRFAVVFGLLISKEAWWKVFAFLKAVSVIISYNICLTRIFWFLLTWKC